jgi:hypothetical protein
MEKRPPEQAPEARSKLLFNDLETGESIVLKTASGSTYRLLVSEIGSKTLVTLERQGNHDVKEDEVTRWERVEPGTLFDLRGSCRQMLVYGDSPVASGTTGGQFTTGERAWLGALVDGTDRTLITSPVETIETIKPSRIS